MKLRTRRFAALRLLSARRNSQTLEMGVMLPNRSKGAIGNLRLSHRFPKENLRHFSTALKNKRELIQLEMEERTPPKTHFTPTKSSIRPTHSRKQNPLPPRAKVSSDGNVAPERNPRCLRCTKFWSILPNFGSAGDDLQDSGGAENAKKEPVKNSVLPYVGQT